MDVLRLSRPESERETGNGADRPLAAFRAADAFAQAAAAAALAFSRPEADELRAAVLDGALRCGAGLLLASESPRGSASEISALDQAFRSLAGVRFALYLARRLGVLDLRRYRLLASRHESAAREVRALLDRAAASRSP